jgi:ubiquinone/menaquinone biosynthesis C-methylase UbiE
MHHEAMNDGQPLLVCPACRGALLLPDTMEGETAVATCAVCGQIFPQTLGILDLRWPSPPKPDKQTENLGVYLRQQYPTKTSGELLIAWIEKVAQFGSVPDDILSVVQQYHGSQYQRGQQMIDMFCQRAVQFYPMPQSRLALDVGCGIGTSSIALAKRFEKVVGLDPDLAPLLVAQKYLQEQQISHVVLVQAYAQHIPLRDGSVDFAVAQNVIEHLFDIEPAFTQLRRVLATGGLFCGDSRNRFDLFLPEPHVKLRWVGLWPRRWQPWYVCQLRGVAYDQAYLLSLRQLRRNARQSFGSEARVLFPLNTAYGRSARWDHLIQFVERIPILSGFLLSIYPSHLLVAQAALDRQLGY